MCEDAKGLRRKVWTWTKILSTYIGYFVAISRFVAIDTMFRRLGAKRFFLGTTIVFLGQEMHYYMVSIANYSELNLQACNYAQKRRICREKINTRLAKVFINALAERLPTSATLTD